MNQFMQQMMQNMDEDTARKMLSQLDEEQVQQALSWAVDEMVVPHLEEVEERANTEDPPHQQVREYYESLTEQEREDVFYDTLDNLVAVLVQCREEPEEGLPELKTMLRDPYTTEALFLIFENEQHIDQEYTQTLKDFAAAHLHWIGAMVIPEMYDDAEVERVIQQFDLEAAEPDSEG